MSKTERIEKFRKFIENGEVKIPDVNKLVEEFLLSEKTHLILFEDENGNLRYNSSSTKNEGEE